MKAKSKQVAVIEKTIAEELRMSAALKISLSEYDCQVVSTKYRIHITKIFRPTNVIFFYMFPDRKVQVQDRRFQKRKSDSPSYRQTGMETQN
jgi:hypothetical protein